VLLVSSFFLHVLVQLFGYSWSSNGSEMVAVAVPLLCLFYIDEASVGVAAVPAIPLS
jgi:hypothetical protein